MTSSKEKALDAKGIREELEAEAAAPPRFTPFTLKDLYKEKFPPVLWLAEDLIPLGGVTALTGDSNTYKTFLALALAANVATGTPYLEHFAVPVKGKVLIIDEENHRRFLRKRFEELGIAETSDILFISQKGFLATDTEHVESIKETLERERPALVIFDALVRFHDKDENSASEMSKVMHEFKKFVADDRAILIIHHHKKDQGFQRRSSGQSVRGSSDIFASLDCHLAVDRKGQEENIIVNQNKLRVQRQMKPFKVSLVTGGDKKVSLVHQGEDHSREEKIAEVAESIRKMLEASAEPLDRETFHSQIKASKGVINETLKGLVDKGEIEKDNGERGKHLYSLPSEEQDNKSPVKKILEKIDEELAIWEDDSETEIEHDSPEESNH